MKASLWQRGVAHVSFPLDLQEEPAPEGHVGSGLDAHKPAGRTAAAWTPPIVGPRDATLRAASEWPGRSSSAR